MFSLEAPRRQGEHVSMPASSCPFCHSDAKRLFHGCDLIMGLWDAFPVGDGHALPGWLPM